MSKAEAFLSGSLCWCLPENIGQSRKRFATEKHSSLFVQSICDEGEKKSLSKDTCCLYYQNITIVNDASRVVGE
jgi:hypothetical protein